MPFFKEVDIDRLQSHQVGMTGYEDSAGNGYEGHAGIIIRELFPSGPTQAYSAHPTMIYLHLYIVTRQSLYLSFRPFNLFTPHFLLIHLTPLQATFLAMLWASAHNSYSAFNIQSMALAHSHLIEERGLNEGHFDAFVDHLEDSLVACGVAQSVVQELMGIVRPLRVAFSNPPP